MVSPSLPEIQKLVEQLSPQDQLALIRNLAVRLSGTLKQKGGKSLRGAWKGSFPENFDVDNALRQIPSEWHDKLKDI